MRLKNSENLMVYAYWIHRFEASYANGNKAASHMNCKISWLYKKLANRVVLHAWLLKYQVIFVIAITINVLLIEDRLNYKKNHKYEILIYLFPQKHLLMIFYKLFIFNLMDNIYKSSYKESHSKNKSVYWWVWNNLLLFWLKDVIFSISLTSSEIKVSEKNYVKMMLCLTYIFIHGP